MKKLLLTISPLLISCALNAQTIVGDWNFSNGSANDISLHGHNGIIMGGITPAVGQAGIANTALHFDGTSGYVMVPSDPSLNLTTWTLMANVKFEGFYSGQCQDNRLIDRSSVNDYSSDWYSIAVSDNIYDNNCQSFTPYKETLHGGVAGGAPSGGSGSNYHLNTFIQLNQWYCFTATYGSNVMKTYINGALMDSFVVQSNYQYPSSAPLMIGRHINPSFPYWFQGIMDRATIWNGVLSQSQVQLMCDREKTDEPTGIGNLAGNTEPRVLYPNPARDYIYIPVRDTKNPLQIQILTIDGRILNTSYNTSGTENPVKLNIDYLQPGYYKVIIDDAAGKQSYPLIKL